MIIILLAWIYISFISFSWGVLFLKGIQKLYGSSYTMAYGFCITCFIGLAFIGTTAQILSLFMGLDNVLVQAAFFLPAVISSVFLYKPGQVITAVKSFVQSLHPAASLLVCACLLMVLVMGVYPITHPDTIAYHFQAIRWVERYPAVPGLANINYLYGFQNSWFILCGLFSFSFTGTNAITFVNTAVLAWLLIFLANQINIALKKPGKQAQALPWLLLLLFQVWSYTQIRLTATSASPDFIAVLYILLTVYVYVEYSAVVKGNELIVFFLCIFSVTVKLSVLPILLLAFYVAFPSNGRKTALLLLLFSFVMIPYTVRNIITSGHIFFPAAFPDFITADWKFSTDKLQRINNYILAFARTRNSITEPAILLAQPWAVWIKQWWQQLYLSDKIIIVLQIVSLLVLPFRYKTIIAGNGMKKTAIAVVIAGLVFWFLKAPDPRFGMGFLVLLPAFVLTGLINKEDKIWRLSTKKWVLFLSVLSGVSVFAYTGYRLKNYFQPSGAVYPAGVTLPIQSFYYKEINTSIPLLRTSDRNIVLTAAPDSSGRSFNFRGKTASAGFTGKK